MGAIFKNLTSDQVRELVVPLPPLAEQKRIAKILDKADAIRRKRIAYSSEISKLTVSAYLSKFNAPIKSITPRRLGDCVDFLSGGTPSKKQPAYWNGTFPWVSPKDMKVAYINDAQDHVTELAFAETTLKKIPKDSILFVIRGMILAHTVPLAINEASVAINQDMKALIPRDGFDPQFLLWSLKASHNLILSKVATAAHGTKRLEMENLLELPIPDVSAEKQSEFASIVKQIRKLDSKHQPDNLFDSLVQAAFKGGL